jgi:transposase
MVTHANYEKVKDTEGLSTISALTHPQIVTLLEKKVIEPELFDEKHIIEITDPDTPLIRYCLCRNETVGVKETNTRTALLEKTKKELNKIVQTKRKSTTEKIGSRVGKILQKTKMGKFIEWEVKEGKLSYSIKGEKKTLEELIDGYYIIKSDVSPEKMTAEELVSSYKKLTFVEKAFRNLKTIQLEVRPVYHKTDDRIKRHVFICILAYYLQWHMKKKLEPLFKSDGKGKKRRWTFNAVIERLKSIRREVVSTAGVKWKTVTQPDDDQKRILTLLGVTM